MNIVTKADQIRRLAAEGMKVSNIATQVGVRYQHVYNLPVHGAAGLELGLIKAYALPWNIRSSG